MKNETIILTGASGFVGSNLNLFLTKTNFIPSPFSLRNADWISTLDKDSYAIIHQAGKAHDLKKTSEDAEYFEINYELTKKLYEQFLTSNAKKFIFLSSVKAAADSVETILDELKTPTPQTVYGKSKLKAEEYILNNLPVNKKVYILRPCMIYGPKNKGNLNLLYHLVQKGIPWPLGSFNNKRSFCSVENLCFVIKELLERDSIPSGVYNIADDTALSTNELIQLIGKSKNKKVKILKIPKRMIINLARLGDFIGLPLNSERLQKLTESYVVSNNKIKYNLGKELPMDSAEGLLKTFQTF